MHGTPTAPVCARALEDQSLHHIGSPHRFLITRSRVAALALCGLLGVAACGQPPLTALSQTRCPGGAPAPDAVLITATATSAEPAPGLTPDLIQELSAAGLRDDGCVVLLHPDGHLRFMPLAPMRGPNPEQGSAKDVVRQRQLDAVLSEIATMAATTDQLDPVRSLRTAVVSTRQLHIHTILIISSGISTTPPIDLPHLGAWEPETITRWAHDVAESHLDLQGVTVRFVGLGDVAGPQQEPNLGVRNRLASMWLQVCRTAGAAECTDAGQVPGRGKPRSTNVVTPVVLAQVEPSFALGTAYFTIDSATVLPAADTVLRQAIKAVLNTTKQLDISGYTDASTGDWAHNLKLSQRRAEAIRDRLLQLGLPTQNLGEAKGFGSGPYTLEQERLDSRLVAEHRRVMITPRPGDALPVGT